MDSSALQEVELAAGSPASAAASAAASPPAAAADGPALSTGGGSTPGPRCVEVPEESALARVGHRAQPGGRARGRASPRPQPPRRCPLLLLLRVALPAPSSPAASPG